MILDILITFVLLAQIMSARIGRIDTIDFSRSQGNWFACFVSRPFPSRPWQKGGGLNAFQERLKVKVFYH